MYCSIRRSFVGSYWKVYFIKNITFLFVLGISGHTFARTVPMEIFMKPTAKVSKGSISINSNIDYHTGAGMIFGRGYDSFKDESSGTCVETSLKHYDD